VNVAGASAPASGPGLRERLSAELPAALKRRDRVAVGALRSALAAIGDAEAVPLPRVPSPPATSEHVAGAVAGVGRAEAPRRALGEGDVAAVVAAEADERERVATEYARLGRDDDAARLREEAAVLRAVLAGG
jgi:uncharacterized protein YqeY